MNPYLDMSYRHWFEVPEMEGKKPVKKTPKNLTVKQALKILSEPIGMIDLG